MGNKASMRLRRVIRRRLERRGGGTNIAAGIDAVVAANVGERGMQTSSTSRSRIRQSSRGRTSDDGARERRKA